MGRKAIGKKRIQVKINPAALAAIDAAAEQVGQDRSTFIEQAARRVARTRLGAAAADRIEQSSTTAGTMAATPPRRRKPRPEDE